MSKRANIFGVRLWVLGSFLCGVAIVISVSTANSTKKAFCKPHQLSACMAGIPGMPGKPGEPGPAGRDGRDGRDGLNGASGKVGPRGLKGPHGQKGKPGTGKDGVPGKKGDLGPAGPKGEAGPKGNMGRPGIGANWKECVWNKEDGKDTGKIKDCTFIKKRSDTALRVYFAGVLRIYNCDACCSRWYFTFNGVECSGPMTIEGVLYMWRGKNHKDLHRHRHIEGHCLNIHKGKVHVGFWVGRCRSYSKVVDAYTGWNSVSRIFIEEVNPPQK